MPDTSLAWVDHWLSRGLLFQSWNLSQCLSVSSRLTSSWNEPHVLVKCLAFLCLVHDETWISVFGHLQMESAFPFRLFSDLCIFNEPGKHCSILTLNSNKKVSIYKGINLSVNGLTKVTWLTFGWSMTSRLLLANNEPAPEPPLNSLPEQNIFLSYSFGFLFGWM